MDNSSFKSLPAELRITIYEHALTFDRVSCKPRASSRFRPERSLNNQLALTRVCKQIRAECQLLPFTLNKLIVGTAPWQERSRALWQERFFSIAELHSLADDVAQDIASIPSGLMSASTVLTLELDLKAKAMFRYGSPGPLVNAQLITDWSAIKLFFGRLWRATHSRRNIVLDVTPGDEKYGLHLWCEAGYHNPSETGLESRYELRPEITTTPGSSTEHFIVSATFDCAPVRATMDRHQNHDRSLCNVAKHGEQLLAQVAHLDHHAGAIITKNMHVWNRTSPLRIRNHAAGGRVEGSQQG